MPFLENLVTQASVLTLLAISVERYRVVCQPLKGIQDSIAKSAKIIPVLWLISTSCNVPYLYLAVYRDSAYPDGTPIKVCRMNIKEDWHKAYIVFVFFCHFVIPFLVLLILYSRICYILRFTQEDNDSMCRSHQHTTRRRLRLQVINIICSLVLLFFVFHLPMRVIGLWASFTPDYHKVGLETFLNIMYTGRIMFYLNHAFNPIVYNFVSTKFRQALKAVITRRRYKGSFVSSNRRGNYNTPLTKPKQSLILLVEQDFPEGRGGKNGDGTSSSSSGREKLNEFFPIYKNIIQNHESIPDDANAKNAFIDET